MTDDRELLRRYVENRDEGAFTELVTRHVGAVYSAALRRVGGDAPLAEEITQNVFTQCAWKASALQHHPALSGWLHQSSRFAAIDARRARERRKNLEEAVSMETQRDRSSNSEVVWSEIRPVIDAFLDRLGGGERDAVALRFFEGCSFSQIATKLRVSEDAARRRVERALEKLRVALARRGVHSSTAALGLALTQHVSAAAPVGLAATVSAGALSAAPVVGGAAVSGLAFFLMNKFNTAILGVLVAGGAAGVFVELRANRALERETTALSAQSNALVHSERATLSLAVVDPAAADLARLRARIKELKARPDGVVDSATKPKSSWSDAGHTTPEAAIETFIWAATNGRFDTLAQSYAFGEKSKEEADAFFATLSPELRAKYGTPERLFAPYIVAGPTKCDIDGMQVIDVRDGDAPEEAVVHYWVRFADGGGHEDTLPFRRTRDGWRMGSRAMGTSIPAAINFLHEHVDPDISAAPAKAP